jgi:hypothetical protein
MMTMDIPSRLLGLGLPLLVFTAFSPTCTFNVDVRRRAQGNHKNQQGF